MGGTKLAAALVEDARVVERREVAMPKDRSPWRVVQAFVDLGSEWARFAPRVAVAATGHVRRGRVSALNLETLPWTDVDLQSLLRGAFAKPTVVLNDADAAAWGEFRFGAGHGTERFLFVTVSTGVGAGMVLDGRLVEGAEIGFTRLADGTPLELAASGTALDRYAKARGWTGARDVVRHAASDEDAEAALAHAARLIAGKLWDAAKLLDLERVAVGGGLGLASDFRAKLEAHVGVPGLLAPAKLGVDAGLVGAAHWTS
ncbi:N-acylmannosamine kinase/N-acetylmannosamine-6-phosphate 2-epimerase/N-acetylmannosamine kinase [Deinococcus yavapaiensis KR-236]|uniref:N-acylmannosamine kinase/N-acetylmannosamine-6-phosphate 2-epimerase/N-acetylmannosamine kinase n=2 Tax=Deinococcus TaxID=1298 RepID=A0A318SFA7_9DEIO|nr:N-acylmannosamine kinase/N-acetylmannosamine-6-phosphate 2-epimerase/N-acetylmannosamine kinase [Deinococcus yavapaiensis KR-236]